MAYRLIAFIVLASISLAGCNRTSQISQIKLNDPAVGISAEIEVKSDGSFNDEIVNGNVKSIVEGNVRSVGDGKYEVTTSYERKTYTSESTFKSEKLDCTFTAISDTDIPIGKRPVQNQEEGTDPDNALEQFSIQLIESDSS